MKEDFREDGSYEVLLILPLSNCAVPNALFHPSGS